jgi:hypothetical protein
MLRKVRRFTSATFCLLLSLIVTTHIGAQVPKAKKDSTAKRDSASMTVPGMPGMTMANPGSSQGPGMMQNPLGVPMERLASGTTWIPDAVSIPTRNFTAGSWDMMLHGFGFVQENGQKNTRGAWQFGSLNWAMLMASREVAHGRVQLRTMLSLDPATVTDSGYPLLLQTGETFHGQQLHDRQHPHDFLMELAAMYERPFTRTTGFEIYAAPSGEPALGPVAFMHRPSAMDNPAAPIGHHWQDATHISFGVITTGLFTHSLKVEASVFNGREPDENRWNIDPVRLDSYSARVTLNPTVNWSLTAGYGYLRSPEAAQPDVPVHRTVASALYGRKLGSDGQWATTLIWGANAQPGVALSASLLLESEAVLDQRSTVFGRAEWVRKSAQELVVDGPPTNFPPDQLFGLGDVSLGYVREIVRGSGATLGIGGMGTINAVPASLESTYGARNPLGLWLFLRIRPTPSRPMQMMQSPSMKSMDMP